MKRKISIVIMWTLVIFQMFLIFSMSAQDRETSSKTSKKTIEIIAEKVIPKFKEKPQGEKQQFIDGFQHIARKTAHLTIYLMLGFLCMGALSLHKLSKIKTILFAQGISTLYAVSDEIHQYFVPGRGPQVVDVAIDSLGAFVGILFMILLIFVFEKIIKKIHARQSVILLTEKSQNAE